MQIRKDEVLQRATYDILAFRSSAIVLILLMNSSPVDRNWSGTEAMATNAGTQATTQRVLMTYDLCTEIGDIIAVRGKQIDAEENRKIRGRNEEKKRQTDIQR